MNESYFTNSYILLTSNAKINQTISIFEVPNMSTTADANADKIIAKLDAIDDLASKGVVVVQNVPNMPEGGTSGTGGSGGSTGYAGY